jgi:hypothetical protein
VTGRPADPFDFLAEHIVHDDGCPYMPPDLDDNDPGVECVCYVNEFFEKAGDLRAEVDRQLRRHLCYTSDYSRERFWKAVDAALASARGGAR